MTVVQGGHLSVLSGYSLARFRVIQIIRTLGLFKDFGAVNVPALLPPR
jgi:hypothetical protein